MRFLDANSDFGSNADGLFVQTQQEIDTALLKDLQDKRDASMTAPMGDMHHVAAVPVALVEQWRREGFDIMGGKVSAREIVARLKRDHLDGFLATRRRV